MVQEQNTFEILLLWLHDHLEINIILLVLVLYRKWSEYNVDITSLL